MHMLRVPTRPGLSEHEQNKIGRGELLATTFATFERNIREQLARTLGEGGFDPARGAKCVGGNAGVQQRIDSAALCEGVGAEVSLTLGD